MFNSLNTLSTWDEEKVLVFVSKSVFRLGIVINIYG